MTPVSGSSIIVTVGTKPEQPLLLMINCCFFVCLFVFCLHTSNNGSSQNKTAHGLIDGHPCSFKNSSLKASHNKEMILIKEVMVSMNTKQTHTPLSVLSFCTRGIELPLGGKFLLPDASKCF